MNGYWIGSPVHLLPTKWQCAVVGVHDELKGQIPVCFLVPEKGLRIYCGIPTCTPQARTYVLSTLLRGTKPDYGEDYEIRSALYRSSLARPPVSQPGEGNLRPAW